MVSTILFESPCRFSETALWSNQKKFYIDKGIEAWAQDVPSYITCNPFIAAQYAKTTLCFIRDWAEQHPTTQDQIFYIFELGSGTGQFAFHFLKALVELKRRLQCDHFKIRYVMTDVATDLFSFWKNHSALQPYIQLGLLDFAFYDICMKPDFILQLSNEMITSNKIDNPPVIIANYIFDSLPTDLFHVSNGQLNAVLVALKTTQDNLQGNTFIDLQKVELEYHPKKIDEKYYGNAWDTLLFQYANDLTDTDFQLPIQVFKTFDQLKQLFQGRFLLLSSDKGYSALSELDHLDAPEIKYHGNCFSIMVNFHAISAYMKSNQGACDAQCFRDHILTGVFSCGFSHQALPNLHQAVHEMVYAFSATDYFELFKNMEKHYQKASADELLAFLSLSNWDDRFFSVICDHLVNCCETAHPDTLQFLKNNIEKIAAQFYYFPGCVDTYFNIAILYQGLHEFKEAIRYYQASLDCFGKNDVVLFNIAMCHYSLQNKKAALDYLHRALQCNPDLPHIQEMIIVIQGK